MKKTINLLGCLCTALATILFTGCSDDDNSGNPSKPDLEFYALTSTNSLVKYNAKNSQNALSTTAITGLQGGENLLSIDFRPGTGQLYGLGSSRRVYIINTNTGAATALNATPFGVGLSTASLTGFDFNPTVDRIRVVTANGLNFRLNPETGEVAASDTNLSPGTPNVTAAAYTNNYAGATSTELFVIDNTAGTLYKQDANAGVLTSIGSLNISGTITGNSSFDIGSKDGIALASINVDGISNLFQINLSTGKATDLGELSANVIGIAIPTNPVAYAVDTVNALHIFNFNNPGTPITKAITNLQASETILGLDMRPANGQLYALGSTGRIYTINTSSGAAAVVGAGALTLNGTDFGFDFNPTVDRIRIVSNTGQNLRVNPNDGTLSATDTALNPGTPNVTAAAYTNNFPGTTSTALYDIDSTTDMLYRQDPPNNGTLVSVGALGIDVSASNGFDIGGTSNTAYAILSVAGVNSIYTINKDTGRASQITTFSNATIKGFAVGLGF